MVLVSGLVASGIFYFNRDWALPAAILSFALGIVLHVLFLKVIDPHWEEKAKAILNSSELEAIRVRRNYFESRGETGLIGLLNLTSWKSDFEADVYAARKTSDPDTLARAIVKLGRGNFFHPPIDERVKLLREI